MIALPVGFDLQTLDLKLSDSQFFELQKYGALRIAAAFGVKPNFLNDYSKSSYANSAAQNLSFYVDTLLYNVSGYEQEMNRKLLTRAEQERGIGYKFNLWAILRSDPDKQAEIIQKMVTTGIYSIDEARYRLDMPPCDGGDVHMIPGNYVKLTQVGAYVTPENPASEGGETL
jgi:HK97 family phage portal protein